MKFVIFTPTPIMNPDICLVKPKLVNAGIKCTFADIINCDIPSTIANVQKVLDFKASFVP